MDEINAATTGYLPVNGLEMYYEIHGAGQPLVLLHGAFSAIGTSFGALLPELAKTLPEHAVELFRLFGGGVMGDSPAGLPDSQLAILPGTSHVSMVSRADLLLPMITLFLDAPMPEGGTP